MEKGCFKTAVVINRRNSEYRSQSEVWNGKWGVSLWLLYKSNNVKYCMAKKGRVTGSKGSKVQSPNITDLGAWEKKLADEKKACAWVPSAKLSSFLVLNTFPSGHLTLLLEYILPKMKKHDSRRLRFLTSFSYASLDVLSKQLATLFTYIHNTICAR